MSVEGPRSAVFSTMLVSADGRVANWPQHRQRLERHAQRLRINLPPHPPAIAGHDHQGPMLATVRYGAQQGDWTIEKRPLSVHDEDIDAISKPAPRWNERTNGTKHGQWEPYLQAHEEAKSAGCDAALLVHDHAIIDADRATPIVLDEDGTVWLSPVDQGGVDSITATMLANRLPNLGLPVVRGHLNERTVARCAELVVVGTGMGVCHVTSLDGEPLGTSRALSEACRRLLHEHFTDESVWTLPGMVDV